MTITFLFDVTFTVTDGSIWKCTSSSSSLPFARLNPELIRSRFCLRQMSPTHDKVCKAVNSVGNNKPCGLIVPSSFFSADCINFFSNINSKINCCQNLYICSSVTVG